MATFDVSGPDGKSYRVNVPEGASFEDAVSYVKDTYYKDAKPNKAMDDSKRVLGVVSPVGSAAAEGAGKVVGKILSGVSGVTSEVFGDGDTSKSRIRKVGKAITDAVDMEQPTLGRAEPLVEAVGGLGPQIVLGIPGRATALAGAAMQGSGEQVERLEGFEGVDGTDRLLAKAGGGAVGLLEAALPEFLAGRLPLGKFQELIQQSKLGRAGGGAVTEGVTEGAGNISQDLIEQQTYNPDKEIDYQGAAESALIGGIVGGGAGAVSGGPRSEAVFPQDRPPTPELSQTVGDPPVEPDVLPVADVQPTELQKAQALAQTYEQKFGKAHPATKIAMKQAKDLEFLESSDALITDLNDALTEAQESGNDAIAQALQEDLTKLIERKAKIEEASRTRNTRVDEDPSETIEISDETLPPIEDDVISLEPDDTTTIDQEVTNLETDVRLDQIDDSEVRVIDENTLPDEIVLEEGLTDDGDIELSPLPVTEPEVDTGPLDLETTLVPEDTVGARIANEEGQLRAQLKEIDAQLKNKDLEPTARRSLTQKKTLLNKKIEAKVDEGIAHRAQPSRVDLAPPKDRFPIGEPAVDVVPDTLAPLRKQYQQLAKDYQKKGLTGHQKSVITKKMKALDKQINDQLDGNSQSNVKANAAPTIPGTPIGTQLESTVDSIVKGWGNSPVIEYVDSITDPAVAGELTNRYGSTQPVKGYYVPPNPNDPSSKGKVVINRSAIQTIEDAVETIYHDVIGHHGMQGKFGSQLDGILSQLAQSRPDLIQSKADAYGIDTVGNESLLAEEALADLAGRNPNLGIVKRAVAAIRNFARNNIPGFTNMKMTDEDIIQQWILPARDYVSTRPWGTNTPTGAPTSPSQASETQQGSGVAQGSQSPPAALSDARQRITQGNYLSRAIDGLADRLIETDNPTFQKLGRAVQQFVDRKARHMGRFNFAFREANRILSKHENLIPDWSSYYRNLQKGDKKAAQAILTNASPDLKSAIDSTNAALKYAGEAASAAGIKVLSRTKGGKRAWVDFKMRDDYFPLVVDRQWQAVLSAPRDLENRMALSELATLMVKEGKLKPGSTLEQLAEMIEKEQSSRQQYTDGFFGNLERSRSDLFPMEIYDFSPQTLRSYRDNFSQRVAQVEAFGQNTDTTSTLWKDAEKVASGSNKGSGWFNDKAWVAQAAQQVLGTDINDNPVIPNGVQKTFAFANNIATGLQLGSLGGAMTNSIGGMMLNTAYLGPAKTLKAMKSMALDLNELVKDGVRMGVVRDDTRNIHKDAQEALFNPEHPANRIFQGSQVFTDKALKLSGFNLAETTVRLIALRGAQNELSSQLESIAKGENTAATRKFKDQVKRWNLDIDAMMNERGSPEKVESEKFYRKLVNTIQGSYDVDMIPVYVNTPAGRFFFKYWAFTTMVNRNFVKEVAQPFAKAMKSGNTADKIEASKNLFTFGAAAVLGQIAFEELKEQLFGTVSSDTDIGPLAKLVEEERYQEAATEFMDVLWSASLNSGMTGSLGNYVDMTNQHIVAPVTGVPVAKFAKTPIDPPGLAAPAAVSKYALTVIDRLQDPNGSMNVEDFDNFAREMSRLYRETKGMYKSASRLAKDENGDTSYYGRKFDKERDLKYTNQQVARFLRHKKIPESEWTPQSVRPMSTIENARVREAVLMGETDRARELIAERLNKAELNSKQYRAIKDSMTKSINFLDPMYFNVSNHSQNDLQKEFLEWSQQNLPAGEYARMYDFVKTLRENAQEVGLWKPAKDPSPSQTRILTPQQKEHQMRKDFGG